MFGTKYARMVHGEWHHVGYLNTSGLPITGSLEDTVLRKFTPVVQQLPDNEYAMMLASGYTLGFLTQDVDKLGLSGDTGKFTGGTASGAEGFRNFSIGKLDNPVKYGEFVSVRVPVAMSQLEFEGVGGAVPGNLVVTTGGAALSAATLPHTELTTLNGALQVAAPGDVVMGRFIKSIDPIVDSGNLRVVWEWVPAQYIKA